MTRVLVVDACPKLRAGLRVALSSMGGITEVIEAGTAAQAMQLARDAEPDVAVVSVDLPDQSGFELCRWLADASQKTRTLLVSTSDHDFHLAEAWSARAAGFVSNRGKIPDSIRALREGKKGGLFTSEQLERILACW